MTVVVAETIVLNRVITRGELVAVNTYLRLTYTPGASIDTLRKRVLYGGRKGRSAARRLRGLDGRG